MYEILTPLHTGICRHCSGAITMFRGGIRADWYHDDGGQRTCPGAPLAWPIEDTIRDAPPSSNRPGNPDGSEG